MASKHLKKVDTAAKGSQKEVPAGSHESPPPKEKKEPRRHWGWKASEEKKAAAQRAEQELMDQVAAVLESESRGPRLVKTEPVRETTEAEQAAQTGKKSRLTLRRKDREQAGEAPEAGAAPQEAKKRVFFRREKVKEAPSREEGGALSQRDAAGAIIALVAALVLLAATAVVYVYRDSFSPDGMILSVDKASTPNDEYVFDAGSGQAFAAAGKGLAVANSGGLELLDGSGAPVTSMVMQMENPTAAGCSDFVVFYDLGGTHMAVAWFDGTVEELTPAGNIISATVSETGFIAVTTEYTGRRALVTVYDPNLDPVYEWYSSSAWVISGAVSPDGRKLAVLSYTASGSEVRFFNLSREEQQAVFSVEDTILLDLHWFSSSRLCALSSQQVLFFDDDGQWQNTYAFAGQYLIGYTFDTSNCVAFALSPYRAGTTASLVSLDSTGAELGTAQVNSELVCLTASDLEIMALCSDGAVLYTDSLNEKGRLTGLPGFKYGLLRSRGEALLIASNYAEVYTF